ncbi:arsenosugar biosynthesis radical SAM protein ArsS [Pseudomonadales bacterium]|nr:arsenosugar biosynthesis radical SAM protein ArsS [Pseudomonadales bacterium]MDA9298520.1 arsenosugar biosynthesis radical SAM protein ArsS [Pseudomonadales bacterium]MDB4150772.1 arsenosugar biosynthesis radical SAM protein ArsS [Pseudomonadales bacterium]MDB9868665.1 arsenosugar biosynthesis radical SAM protein ArsS [Pseudomonadales bacterium]MDB9916502.1 arsenosugar biosynthesis radical SAM protein ArsS [Pseudomonadales bacterium]
MLDTRPLLLDTDFPAIKRDELTTLQVNLGYLCNLSCTHCHVNAGPTRTELMDMETIEIVLKFLAQQKIQTLDMTGGSPEMNPHFKYLVTAARALGVTVMNRCNPTILMEPGYEDLPQFFADNNIVVVASMPCYQEQNVDRQRGKGVYADSIAGLLKLNLVGYGAPGSNLELNLVYNPDDPILPPDQQTLENDYKRELRQDHGIEFNQLFALANMPISRYGARLLAKNQYTGYMTLLRDAFEVGNLATVMCRSLISVDYQGFVYDCDFNQMLELPLIGTDKIKPHLRELLDTNWNGAPISVGEHCYGCTAGQGSSCGGALAGVE